MSKKAVTEDAELFCTLGTQLSQLKVPDFHGAKSQEKKQANITDSKPNYNIFSFGNCKRTTPPPACTPLVVMNWLKGQPDFTLDYELALLEDCIVPCCHGGIIKIKECGQK